MELSDILHNLKIQELTPMQEAAKEAYQSAKDLVLLSPTGSGKTLAFLLPLVQTLKADIQGVQALVLVPSRELALQIETVFKSMGNSFQSYELLWRTPAMARTTGQVKGRFIPPSLSVTPGTYERPFEERKFQCRHCRHSGDR